MDSDPRRFLLKPTMNFKNMTDCCKICCYQDENNREKCYVFRREDCPPHLTCVVLPYNPSLLFHPPPRPPPRRVVGPPSGDAKVTLRELAVAGMAVLACAIIAAVLFCVLCAVGRAFYLRRNRNRSRRRDPPIIFDTQEDFLDEDQGPGVDHHIWYIHTVGLPQSVIDSIAVFVYKKDERLIDGTDCSVCLSEFQEDENLRLLPKCSHAFHIPCIDTWLRSHKNCPLCRAPIISGAVVAQASESGSSLDSRNGNMVDNLENHSGEGSDDVEEGGTVEARIGHDNNNSALSSDEEVFNGENSNKNLPLRLKTTNVNSDSRVLSDLTDNRRVIEGDMQPIRRSFSLDSFSTLKIYNAAASVVLRDKHQASVESQMVDSKRLKSKIVSKRSGGSGSISKLVKSASIGIGLSLQKGPISMKRTMSSGGKCSSSRHSRRHSILPL